MKGRSLVATAALAISVCQSKAEVEPVPSKQAIAEFLENSRIPQKLVEAEKRNLAVWGHVGPEGGIYLAKLDLDQAQYLALFHDPFFSSWNESKFPADLWTQSWGLANDLPDAFVPIVQGKCRWISYSVGTSTRLYFLETRMENDTLAGRLYFFYSRY